MKQIIATLLWLVGVSLSGLCLAEPSSTVAFDGPTRRLLATADPDRGRDLAESARCQKCHGLDGLSRDAESPHIGGLLASYAYKQLQDYKSGSRDHRRMRKRVRKLSDRDLADLAVYYASESPPAWIQDSNIETHIQRLVYRGDPRRLVRACAACHGYGGRGSGPDAPALEGMHVDYFITTMEAFREGERGNDIYSRMRNIAEELTDEEIEGLAQFFAGPPTIEDEESEQNGDAAGGG